MNNLKNNVSQFEMCKNVFVSTVYTKASKQTFEENLFNLSGLFINDMIKQGEK